MEQERNRKVKKKKGKVNQNNEKYKRTHDSPKL